MNYAAENSDLPLNRGLRLNRQRKPAGVHAAGYFRLRLGEARSIVSEVERATSNWRRDAADLGLARHEIDRMAAAFDSDQRRSARDLAGPPTQRPR